ncbi:hypothetical protein L596_024234 [Steinernema carpocapsae]|uniref:Uncharacterized protein n=1 Tax=Steinernema carpocapsae TaxID=34508 RepID=A0A4U5MGU9_STECR|nr:hypothetical protein L596_024234 [Steinernema carpocapsae]
MLKLLGVETFPLTESIAFAFSFFASIHSLIPHSNTLTTHHSLFFHRPFYNLLSCFKPSTERRPGLFPGAFPSPSPSYRSPRTLRINSNPRCAHSTNLFENTSCASSARHTKHLGALATNQRSPRRHSGRAHPKCTR